MLAPTIGYLGAYLIVSYRHFAAHGELEIPAANNVSLHVALALGAIAAVTAATWLSIAIVRVIRRLRKPRGAGVGATSAGVSFVGAIAATFLALANAALCFVFVDSLRITSTSSQIDQNSGGQTSLLEVVFVIVTALSTFGLARIALRTWSARIKP
jgi:hypothetical protein